MDETNPTLADDPPHALVPIVAHANTLTRSIKHEETGREETHART